MNFPSRSCLFYLFAFDFDLGRVHRREYGVAVPGTQFVVPLGRLEGLLIEVAFWELIEGGQILAQFVADTRPPPDQRYRLGKFISFKNPGLRIYRRTDSPPPPPRSLAQQLSAVIPCEGTSVAVAVIDWAQGRWPLRADAVVSVAAEEATHLEIVSAKEAEKLNGVRSSKYIIGAPPADCSRLDRLWQNFTDARDAWDRFGVDRPQDADRLRTETRRTLRMLRPDWGSGGGGEGG
jgi:hypothetical protein